MIQTCLTTRYTTRTPNRSLIGSIKDLEALNPWLKLSPSCRFPSLVVVRRSFALIGLNSFWPTHYMMNIPSLEIFDIKGTNDMCPLNYHSHHFYSLGNRTVLFLGQVGIVGCFRRAYACCNTSDPTKVAEDMPLYTLIVRRLSYREQS